jgi:dihydroorotase (multifunctional complex type)
MYELVLKACKAFYKDRLVCCDVGVDSGKIIAIGRNLRGENVIDCSHKFVFPGLIDVHVHFRVPGNEWKEDWKSASKAALHGGVTAVLDMPNNRPAICDEKTLALKETRVAKDARIDYGFYLGVSDKIDELDESVAQKIAGLKLYMGATTANLLVEEPALQCKAFSAAARYSKVIAVHAEDHLALEQNIASAKKTGKYELRYHHKIRDAKVEAIAIKNALALAEQTQAFLHICHVSSSFGVELIKEAKVKKLAFSCGITPHHLFLTNRDVEALGNIAKVNPSIKTKQDRKALWEALNSGLIDIIESDHAPHTLEEKQCDYESACSGIPGIETMLPLLLDAYARKLISLKTIFNCCCRNPARIFGLSGKGEIKLGNDADFCIVDLKRKQRISAESLFTKCGWSPFEGRKLKGHVEKTIFKGLLCFDNGQIVAHVKGKNFFEGG